MKTIVKTGMACLSFIFASLTHANFAKVVDNDGYVNIRQGKNSQSKLLGCIASQSFVFVHDEDRYEKWVFSYTEKDLSGYIHKSRLAFIDESRQGVPYIPQILFDKKAGIATFESDDVRVTIKTAKFDYEANQHLFTKVNTEDAFYYLSHYKGQPFLGTDGMPPKGLTYYKSITAIIGNQTVSIPQYALDGLFYVHLDIIKVYYHKADKALYIAADSGSGAGSYEVLFVIKDGVYQGKTIIGYPA